MHRAKGAVASPSRCWSLLTKHQNASPKEVILKEDEAADWVYRDEGAASKDFLCFNSVMELSFIIQLFCHTRLLLVGTWKFKLMLQVHLIVLFVLISDVARDMEYELRNFYQ